MELYKYRAPQHEYDGSRRWTEDISVSAESGIAVYAYLPHPRSPYSAGFRTEGCL